MNRKYVYRRADIIFPYCIFLIFPIILAYILLNLPLKECANNTFFLVFCLVSWTLLAIWFFPLLLWMINNFKTIIVLNDIGIIYKRNMYREVVIKWGEIAKIDKQILCSLSYGRTEEPGDLVIYSTGWKKIKVYKILQGVNDSREGIAEFEQEIRERINLDNKIDSTTFTKNQLHLGIVAGFVCLIGVFITSYTSPELIDSLLGRLSKLLGFYGTVILMIFASCFIIGYCAYMLKKWPEKNNREKKTDI